MSLPPPDRVDRVDAAVPDNAREVCQVLAEAGENDLLVSLDADTRVETGYLEAVCRLLFRGPEPGCAGTCGTQQACQQRQVDMKYCQQTLAPVGYGVSE